MPDTTPSDVASEPSSEQTVEFYETEEGVVLYDSENPLGWIQSRTALAVESMR
jgi:galactose mutarotase-like enzyme